MRDHDSVIMTYIYIECIEKAILYKLYEIYNIIKCFIFSTISVHS